MMQMRRLDPADPRIVGRVAVLQVVDFGVRRHAARAFDEFVGDRTQPPHLVRAQDIGYDDGADFVVLFDLGSAQHCILRLAGA
jgi:hypothetical protein